MPRRRKDAKAEPARLPGEAIARKDLRERARAWWIAVIAGQADQSHPVHGNDVRAHLDGDTLVVAGTVASPDEREEIEREIEHLRLGPLGVARVRNELQVAEGHQEERGLLAQTLTATFATEEQAGFAAGYLEGHAQFHPDLVRTISPGNPKRARALVAALLPEALRQEAEAALAAGQFFLVVTVDEVDAFRARELLDEETHSMQTLVLPPEPAEQVERLRAALRDAEGHVAGDAREERAERTRTRVREHEQAVHDA